MSQWTLFVSIKIPLEIAAVDAVYNYIQCLVLLQVDEKLDPVDEIVLIQKSPTSLP